ncbi:MAG TPA: hypothetical protein PLJ62_00400 [Thermoflexales bacterium]|nr:hypothetical protein [Thermoflexales bacterium]
MQIVGRTEDGQLIIALLTNEEVMRFSVASEEPRIVSAPAPILELAALADMREHVIRFDCESTDAETWLLKNMDPKWGRLDKTGEERQYVLFVRKTYDLSDIGLYLTNEYYKEKNVGTWVEGVENKLPKL